MNCFNWKAIWITGGLLSAALVGCATDSDSAEISLADEAEQANTAAGSAGTAGSSTEPGAAQVAETVAPAPGDVDCSAAGVLCAQLVVPESYAGVPTKVATVLYDSPETARFPDEMLPEMVTTEVVPGQSMRGPQPCSLSLSVVSLNVEE